MMDVYCERIGPELLAEPLNAVSNTSFLLAAWAAWILATRTGTLSTGVRVLIALAASVGIGSMLWHTLANSWTLILDIVPILIFLIWYIWLYTRNVIGMRSRFTVAAVGAFLVGKLSHIMCPLQLDFRWQKIYRTFRQIGRKTLT
jgi:hypothetical protein